MILPYAGLLPYLRLVCFIITPYLHLYIDAIPVPTEIVNKINPYTLKATAQKGNYDKYRLFYRQKLSLQALSSPK